jgi:large subunit ribosomal protein L22
MEARATYRFIPSSPRKMRLVIDLVRGMNAVKAMQSLQFQPKHASNDALKVIKSAVSNLINNHEELRIQPEEVFIKEIFVNNGPSIKRMLPAPMGRAYRIRKRMCHLTVVVKSINKKGQEE